MIEKHLTLTNFCRKSAYFHFICISVCLHVLVCTTCVPSSHRALEGALSSLNLEFKTVVSYHVGAEN